MSVRGAYRGICGHGVQTRFDYGRRRRCYSCVRMDHTATPPCNASMYATHPVLRTRPTLRGTSAAMPSQCTGAKHKAAVGAGYTGPSPTRSTDNIPLKKLPPPACDKRNVPGEAHQRSESCPIPANHLFLWKLATGCNWSIGNVGLQVQGDRRAPTRKIPKSNCGTNVCTIATSPHCVPRLAYPSPKIANIPFLSHMSTPPTPTHVAPDVEAVLPPTPFLAADIDLNPDLDEDDDMDGTPVPMETPVSKEPDDTEPDPQIDLWTLTFDDAFEIQRIQFEKTAAETLSLPQQSRFVSFLDEELLHIQRHFVKHQAGEQPYPLELLLADVQRVLDLVWVLVNSSNSLYGQEEYLVKICGDLEDWIVQYDLMPNKKQMALADGFFLRFFAFFQSLDTRLSFLIDGFVARGRTQKMSPTQFVRLGPIVSRLRFEIITRLDPVREYLERTGLPLLNKLDVEIGRLFEGVLERG